MAPGETGLLSDSSHGSSDSCVRGDSYSCVFDSSKAGTVMPHRNDDRRMATTTTIPAIAAMSRESPPCTSAYFALVHGGLSRDMAAIAGMVVVVAIRLSSLRWGITVPAFELSNTQEYESPRTHESDEP